MKGIELTILWTRTGDKVPGRRKSSYSVEVPVKDGTPLSEEQLRLLGLLESHQVTIEEPSDVIPFNAAIAAAEQAEKERAEDAIKDTSEAIDRLKRADTWWKPSCLDSRAKPYYTPSVRDHIARYGLSEEADRLAEEYWALKGELDERRAAKDREEHAAKVAAHIERVAAWAEADDDSPCPYNSYVDGTLPQDLQDRMAAKKAAQTERRERLEKDRIEYISEWAEMHGSDRLKSQIAMGLDGWPRYLHERISDDWGDLNGELDNDGENGDTVRDPDMKALELVRNVAAEAVMLGQFPTPEAARSTMEITPITFKQDDPYDDPRTGVFVILYEYHPGPARIFEKAYRIRFPVEE